MAEAAERGRAARPHPVIWRVIVTLALVGLVWLGTVNAARALLRGVTWSRGVPAAGVLAPIRPTPVPTYPPSTAVGLGATQSYDGLTLTVSDARFLSVNGIVAAPKGARFVLLTVRVVNITGGATLPYNAYDFALAAPGGSNQREAFAAADDPLGAGALPPGGVAQGEIAYLTPLATAPSPQTAQVIYLPSAALGPPLAWIVPLATSGTPRA